MSLCVIIIIYKYHTSKNKEGYSNVYDNIINDTEKIKDENTNYANISHLYKSTESTNPFSNILIGDKLDVNDKPAPPAFNNSVNNNIIDATKSMIQKLNPDIKDIDDKLCGNLVDKLQFEQNLRPFYSTPNTNIATDQDSFIDFLYGDMPSCKNKKFKNENVNTCTGNDSYNLF
jgi:hypothetical protein